MKKKNILWIKPIILIGLFLMFSFSCKKDKVDTNTTQNGNNGIVTDFDGNVYHTVTIGTQIWMKENLKVTHYNDGTPIPLVADATAWSNLSSAGYCWYNNDKVTNGDTYGALYNWYTVNTNKLCPTGWHVPSNAEWTAFENYLLANGFNYDGTATGNKYAKAIASGTGWSSNPFVGTVGNTDYPAKRNITGFTALPGGYRYLDGSFSNIGNYACWWSTTEYNTISAWYRNISGNHTGVESLYDNKTSGFSVRCVKD